MLLVILMGIKLLPDEIVNQIAAGEVIENPAAVVKELVENSIDAGSSLIEIEIEDYGLKKIIVKDNGCGIPKEDLLKAPLRHATSKIESFNDLYNIKTMGFRGEALASIFSVAKTKIVSKTNNEGQAYEISSGSKKDVKKSECQRGTQIIVKDIFYNTPARKKYLRSNNMELKSILDVVRRFEIFYNNIKFTVKHNGKIIINKPIFEKHEDNLYYVLGKELRDNLFIFEDQINGLKIQGFVGKPSNITYSTKKNQFVFVNSRFVKSKIVNDAIYEGYGTNLMEGRHPFFVVFLDIDPEIIDVNVHPTKIEIKFENELEIYDFVKNSIRKIFEKNESFKEFEIKKRDEISLENDKWNIEINEKNKSYSVQKENKYFTKDVQKELSVVKEKLGREYLQNKENLSDKSTEYGPLHDILKEYKIIGQVNKTFIIIETKNEMIIIDQHVAQEKFFFESFKEQLGAKKPKTQKLLKSEIVKLDNSEMLLFKDNKVMIEKLGFECEIFGTNEILIRAVPYMLNGEILAPEIIRDIVHEIRIDKKFKLLEEEKIEKLASLSCKKSIKAGKELTNFEIKEIIEKLKRLKEPFNCPHGRPILLKWDFKELEKKFKRIV